MGAETIHLASHHKSLKVCIEGGEMGVSAQANRTPPVKRAPVAIQFKGGAAKVEIESPRFPGATWKDCDWLDLKAKNRAAAVDALRKVNGHGTDFTIVDATVEADVRAPAAVR